MIGDNIPCKVIPIKNGLFRIGRNGVAALKGGEMLYYLWHEPTGLYYHTCYVSQEYALYMAGQTNGPRSMSDVAMAWVTEPKRCQHSWRTQPED